MPKETLYRQFEFTRTEFHGQDRVEVSDSVWVPYQRYPRLVIAPPSVELIVTQNSDKQLFITVPQVLYNEENSKNLLHTINLFLELFGFCHIFNVEKAHIEKLIILKRLNWEVLPKGKMPWNKIVDEIKKHKDKQGNKAFLSALDRFDFINQFEPDFHAIGRNGYKGYVVFGFSEKSIFVLESQLINNATYIFDQNWEDLSSLTKAEILHGSLHKDRLIHRPKWDEALTKIILSQ